mmetsp:Transcript_10712/g.18222  ORF Transcript_10712/g.18222 Transcript_10712/m.18222 type:complete len:320 (-) Transcript_10712:3740-4699(-)
MNPRTGGLRVAEANVVRLVECCHGHELIMDAARQAVVHFAKVDALVDALQRLSYLGLGRARAVVGQSQREDERRLEQAQLARRRNKSAALEDGLGADLLAQHADEGARPANALARLGDGAAQLRGSHVLRPLVVEQRLRVLLVRVGRLSVVHAHAHREDTFHEGQLARARVRATRPARAARRGAAWAAWGCILRPISAAAARDSTVQRLEKGLVRFCSVVHLAQLEVGVEAEQRLFECAGRSLGPALSLRGRRRVGAVLHHRAHLLHRYKNGAILFLCAAAQLTDLQCVTERRDIPQRLHDHVNEARVLPGLVLQTRGG